MYQKSSDEIVNKINMQRTYFSSGATLPVRNRINALKSLKTNIIKFLDEIHDALKSDLGKSASESYMCETGMVLSEITYMLKHIRNFAREHSVITPLSQFPSRSYVKPSPYGTVLIMSPWNYPFLLTLEPLVDALAAGNTAVIKPSAYSPNTAEIVKRIIKESFPSEYVTVVTGGREENQYLLKQKFDYIFFTGSPSVGREVMEHASRNLTPITLELGGKSPCIVDETANIPLAARRIVFGKYLNCGQTCVAPDYIYCHTSVKEQLLREIVKEIRKQYGEKPLYDSDYGKIINQKHFDRLCVLMKDVTIFYGGETSSSTCQIAPTVLTDVSWSSPVMCEEIFGPLMPVMEYTDINEVIKTINSKPHPLALYLFSDNRNTVKQVTSSCLYGGGCINDTIIHLATSNMGVGGVGASGMGSYHGRDGFNAFSHQKSIVDKKTWLDLPIRYKPYNKFHDKLITKFLK